MAAKAQTQLKFDVHLLAHGAVHLQGDAGKRLAVAQEWLELVGNDGPPTEKERREWLKAKHGLA